MAGTSTSRRLRSLLLCVVFGGVLLYPSAGRTQIKVDGTLTAPGVSTDVGTGPTFNIGANLGTMKGNNLFHSFDTFNLSRGQTAIFSGPATTSNVISRVTGHQASTIDGTIQSIPGASFYFFNPSGVFFKENARLNVTGSLHVSTADYLGFPGGIQFPALAQPIPPANLSSAAPSSFGFLGPTAASITIDGSMAAPTLQVSLPAGALPLNRTLSIVGGDVTIQGPALNNSGTLLSRGGLVQVVSVKSAGEATLVSAPNQPPDVNVNGFSQLGVITLANGAVIDAGGRVAANQLSGTVLIRGGRLELDNSSIFSNTTA